MKVQAWGATDVGKTREHNEDAFFCDPNLGLFMVCDGMGGHAAGEVASAMAVETVRKAVEKNQDLLKKVEKLDGTAEKHDVLAFLDQAIQSACSTIHDRAQAEPEKRGMGTTVDLLLVAGMRGFIAHVGDSRIYLVRHNKVHQLTEDHSIIAYLIKTGRLKPDEVDSSPYAKYKNAVTRAVGVYETVEVDTFDFDILPGDTCLLCSDGLSYYLNDNRITKVLEAESLEISAKTYIDLANAGGGHDNITAVLVRAPEQVEKAHEVRAADVQQQMAVLAKMSLFRELAYKQLVRILNISTTRSFATGDVVVHEGDPGDELFVVLTGTIALTKDETYITTFSHGDYFGEMALVDSSPRSATAVAAEPTRVLVIHQNNFFRILRKEPEIAVKLLWNFVRVLTDRLRRTTADLSGARLEAAAEDLSSEATLLETMPDRITPQGAARTSRHELSVDTLRGNGISPLSEADFEAKPGDVVVETATPNTKDVTAAEAETARTNQPQAPAAPPAKAPTETPNRSESDGMAEQVAGADEPNPSAGPGAANPSKGSSQPSTTAPDPPVQQAIAEMINDTLRGNQSAPADFEPQPLDEQPVVTQAPIIHVGRQREEGSSAAGTKPAAAPSEPDRSTDPEAERE
ncbi:MAG: Stp1/IreP family PP2C-type Ser/Thr phosphatase [Deltaproteobacteria bacterium]|nr:Stp1/IreP family PP2C-type Ser/Thr phosphatase [Deltaproteobacteria bacterium]